MASKAVQKIEIEAPAVPATTSESGALISMIERAARDPSVDITKMERLFEMHQRVQTQGAKTAYLAALAKLQAELPAVERKGKGHNDKRYARFEDFIEVIKPCLAKNGFSLTWRVKQEPSIIRTVAVLGHEAGHQEETELALPIDNSGNKNPVQGHGSSISYGKRYTGLTLLGVATEDEDDDGKAAGATPKKTITDEQAEQLSRLVGRTEAPTEIGKIILQRCKVQTFAEVPADRFEKIKDWLKDKFGVE